MPKRSVSIHRRPCAAPARPRRTAWVAALLAAAVGLSGWATFGSASRRAPAVRTPVAPSRRDGALESLRSALARAALSHGVQPQTSQPEPEDDGSSPSDSETTEAEPGREEAEDPESSEESSESESAENSDDSPDFARFRNWRSYFYRRYRPYWYDGTYDMGSYGAENDQHGPSGGWAIPGGPPVADGQASPSNPGAVSPCPPDPQRWLVRLQGRPLTAESGAGLVCLTSSASSSAGGERLWLLSGLLRLIARASPTPERLALLVHGGALGVLIPPSLGGDPGRLAANLRVLGLGGHDARAAAVVSAFRSVGSNHQRRVIAIDSDLSLIVMEPRELAGLVASEKDGTGLRRALGVEPSSAARDAGDELPSADLVPSLPEDTAVGVELDGCPGSRHPTDDAAPVSRALCVGDGQLVGGREGNTATMFYEVEAAHEASPSSAS